MVLAQGHQPLVFLEKCSQCGSLRKKGKAGRVSLLGLEALRRPLRRVEFSECMSCPPAGCFSPKGTWVLQLFVHQIEDGRGREQQDHTLHIIHHLPFSSCYISNLCQKKKKKVNQTRKISCNPAFRVTISISVYICFRCFFIFSPSLWPL